MAPDIAARVCNICGASVDPERELVWVKNAHAILRCPTCSLLFRSDPPGRDELVSLYAETYFRAGAEGNGGEGYPDYVGDEDLHRANARVRLDLLARYVRPGRLLDVGCAAGFFLDEARRRGFSVTGVELSQSMAQFARKPLGLDVIEAPFAEVGLERERLDCVTMWDYIEHSVDPSGDLRRASELLRPGGVLGLSTGDAASFVARASGRRWHLLTPQHHNFFFTRTTLIRALEQAGFVVTQVAYLPARYSVRYLAHKTRTLVDLSVFRALERRLVGTKVGAVAVPVNLRDIVTIVARVTP